MVDGATSACLLLGSFFVFIAALGFLRLPDFYMRVSATTKAATFGVGFSLLAAVLHFDDLGVVMRSLATIVFLFVTAPVAAHVIGRAAYMTRTPMWERSVCDQLKGSYDRQSKPLETSNSPADMGEGTQ